MTDYAGYAVLMTLATTTLVKFHLVNMWASCLEYFRNIPGWVATRYRKRIGTYEVVGTYDLGQWFAFLVGLGLWLGWIIYYATTYNATATATWHPTDQWTVGFQGIFFAYTFAGLSYKFYYYKMLREKVFDEGRNWGPMQYLMSRMGKTASWDDIAEGWWGMIHSASYTFLEGMTLLSFVAYCVLTLVILTVTYPTSSTTVANSGYPDNTYAAVAQAGWGLLAAGFVVQLMWGSAIQYGDWKIWPWSTGTGGVMIPTVTGDKVIPYSVIQKFKPAEIPRKHLAQPYTGKKEEFLRVGAENPRVLKASHPEAPLLSLVKRQFQNLKDFDVDEDVAFYPTKEGGVGAISRHSVADMRRKLEDTGRDVGPMTKEESLLDSAIRGLEGVFQTSGEAEDGKYLKAVAPTHIVTDDVYAWGFGLALHQYVNGVVMGAFNILDLSACIAFMGQGSLGFILYFITTGWPTLLALLSERGFWWELVAWHKLVGVTIIQINQLSLLPATAFVLEGVWRRTLGSVPLPNLIVTQQVLAALGCTLAIFSFVWGFLMYVIKWTRPMDGNT